MITSPILLARIIFSQFSLVIRVIFICGTFSELPQPRICTQPKDCERVAHRFLIGACAEFPAKHRQQVSPDSIGSIP